MNNHPAPNGSQRFRLGKFDYVFRGDSVSLSLQTTEPAFVRGKAFSEIKIHFLLKDGKWVYENQPWLIKRKETLHEATPAQLSEIYAHMDAEWNAYWKGYELLQKQFRLYRRSSEISALLDERNMTIKKLIDVSAQLEAINAKLDTYL